MAVTLQWGIVGTEGVRSVAVLPCTYRKRKKARRPVMVNFAEGGSCDWAIRWTKRMTSEGCNCCGSTVSLSKCAVEERARDPKVVVDRRRGQPALLEEIA